MRAAAAALVLALAFAGAEVYAAPAAHACEGGIQKAAGRFSTEAHGATARERYLAFVRACGPDEAVSLAKALVRFETVSSLPPEKKAPAFEAMRTFLARWAKQHGFSFRAVGKDDVFEITWGDEPLELGLIFHGDVVPAPRHEWKRAPFKPVVVGGRLHGRGAEDDKGPLAATLATLAMAKAMKLQPAGGVRVIVGNGEEGGWAPMIEYAKTAPKMRYGISIDSEYPVVAAQYGFVAWTLKAARGGETVTAPPPVAPIEVTAGEFLTQVPGRAALTVQLNGPSPEEDAQKLEAAVARLAASRKESNVRVEGRGRARTIVATGRAVHASMPEDGHNALWDLAAVATGAIADEGPIGKMLGVIARSFDGDLHGRKLGVFYEDALMGSLVAAPTVLRTQGDAVVLQINLRRPRGKTADEFHALLDAAAEKIRKESGGAVVEDRAARRVGDPHVGDPEGALVKTLLDVYREHQRAQGEIKPTAIRGGTYAKLFPGAVDFGPMFPGDPYTGHAPDESIALDRLASIALMTADAFYRLAVRDQRTSPSLTR